MPELITETSSRAVPKELLAECTEILTGRDSTGQAWRDRLANLSPVGLTSGPTVPATDVAGRSEFAKSVASAWSAAGGLRGGVRMQWSDAGRPRIRLSKSGRASAAPFGTTKVVPKETK